MEIILLERVRKLGLMGDVVTVKPGFARNFLLPKRKALRATKENLVSFEKQKKQYEADNLTNKSEAESLAKKMEGLKLTLIRHAGASGHLYGSVAARDIAESATESGFSVDRSQVILDTPIKMLGIHNAVISLHPEVEIDVSLNVAKTEEEAALQEERGSALTAEVTETAKAAPAKASADKPAKTTEEATEAPKEEAAEA